MPLLRTVRSAVTAALFVCLLLVDVRLSGAQATRADREPAATGLIVGRVVEAGTNRPVSGAVVTLTGDALRQPPSSPENVGMPPPGIRVMTTTDGRYLFRALRKGSYTIRVSKPGYLPGAYGARSPVGASQQVELDEGQRVVDAVVTLWWYATISGTVVDEAGEPVVALPVRAFRRSTVGGRRRFTPTVPAITDDRGIYRIPQLAPGDYLVSIVSTQVAVPTSLVRTMREELETATGPMRSPRLQQLAEVGAIAAQPGNAMSTEVGNLTWTLARTATPPPIGKEPLLVYPTTFYPAALNASAAATVTLGSGEERTAVDLQIAPVRCVRVSGVLLGPEGPAQGIAVRLVPPGANEFATPIDAAATITDADGTFTFPAVPPGQYTLRALQVPRAKPAPSNATTIQSGAGMAFTYVTSGSDYAAGAVPNDPTLWAEMPLAIGGNNLENAVVTLRPGARVSGRVEFEGNASRPPTDQLARIGITLESVESMQFSSGSQPGRVEADGQFRTYGVPAGRYVVSVAGVPRGWTFKSVTVEGRDVTDAPLALSGSDVSGLVLTFTDHPSTLTGTVHDSAGGTDADALVVVFPHDPAAWTLYIRNARRTQSTRTSRSGTYRFTGLPSGDYLVAAVGAEAASNWQDAKFLESLAQAATPVRIQDRETQTVDLRTK